MGRNGKGEGCTYKTIKKNKRKKFLSEECAICKNCKDRSKCNNRIGYDKCIKCEQCKTECLKYCDRFYCYEKWIGQATINGKHKTLTTQNKQSETNKIKRGILTNVDTGKYVDKNNITLSELLNLMETSKLNSNIITENTFARNQCVINQIKKLGIGNIAVQKITSNDIQNTLNSIKMQSQSNIDKMYDELNAVFNKAITDKIIIETPIKNVKKPISEQSPKVAIAFSIEEEKTLIEYVMNNTLILDPKCKIDPITLKNIILIALFTGMRIGELGAINYITDIKQNGFKIKNTLTKDKNGKIIIGETTKTGRVNRKNHKLDFRFIPFSVVDNNIITNILNEQIEIAKNTPNNKDNLLFSNIDGTYINHSKITGLFKRICREAKVKLELPKGCHIHMTKHTFVTRCIEAGMKLLTISEIVGTSVRVLEKTYAHILLEFKNKELETLNNYYKHNELDFISSIKSVC